MLNDVLCSPGWTQTEYSLAGKWWRIRYVTPGNKFSAEGRWLPSRVTENGRFYYSVVKLRKEVIRCRSRGESEESFTCRRRSMQARDQLWLWKPGQTSSGVQNRGYHWPYKKNWFSPKSQKVTFDWNLSAIWSVLIHIKVNPGWSTRNVLTSHRHLKITARNFWPWKRQT